MSTSFRGYAPDQSLLLPPDVRAWLPEGHLAHHVSDLVDGLDLTAFYAPYEGDGRRNAPYEPRMMVKVLIYAYATGVFSSRGVAKKLEEDVAFRVLAAGNFPQHRTVCEFRRRHLEDFKALFVEVVSAPRPLEDDASSPTEGQQTTYRAWPAGPLRSASGITGRRWLARIATAESRLSGRPRSAHQAWTMRRCSKTAVQAGLARFLLQLPVPHFQAERTIHDAEPLAARLAPFRLRPAASPSARRAGIDQRPHVRVLVGSHAVDLSTAVRAVVRTPHATGLVGRATQLTAVWGARLHVDATLQMRPVRYNHPWGRDLAFDRAGLANADLVARPDATVCPAENDDRPRHHLRLDPAGRTDCQNMLRQFYCPVDLAVDNEVFAPAHLALDDDALPDPGDALASARSGGRLPARRRRTRERTIIGELCLDHKADLASFGGVSPSWLTAALGQPPDTVASVPRPLDRVPGPAVMP